MKTYRNAGTSIVAALILCFASTALVGCGTSSTNPSAEVMLQGAGATFPNPLYQKWFAEYNKITPNAKFDYQSIGSGGGIKQISSKTVDFAGSDAPMKDDELKAAPGEILHIPTVLGAVVVTYNVPALKTDLKLGPEALAGIYLGKITKWNDPAIKALNPKITLSKNTIVIAHRSDGSGTTFAFTDYLSKVSSSWKGNIGQGKSVPWTAGIGGSGNAGVASVVRNVPWSIGYVELAYAIQNKMTYSYVQNHDKTAFMDANVTTTAAAAKGAIKSYQNLTVSGVKCPSIIHLARRIRFRPLHTYLSTKIWIR